MLEAMRRDDKLKPLFPIWGCNCNKQGATLLEGCLDYQQLGPQRYELAKPNCNACQGAGMVTVHHYPTEFFVRVRGCNTDYGDAAAIREPRISGYYVTGAIQYHTKG